jgi:hypothetical protein
MMAFFEVYDFLLLALLFCLPPLLIAAVRPDLRPLMRTAALLALPFALTERFFYPAYWSPTFLFDLIQTLGFGLEDLLFVAAFGAFAATAYPAFANRSFVTDGAPRLRLAAGLIVAAIGLAVGLHATGLSMYTATIVAEFAVLVALLIRARALALPALLGGAFVTVLYGFLCLLYAALLPGIFDRVWHTEGLFDRAIAGIPLEELLYAFASGALATAVLPVVLRGRWARRA